MNAAGPADSSALADIAVNAAVSNPANNAWLPDVLSVQREGGRWHFALHIDAASPVFSGHFPELPILPGVAQLQWAVAIYQRYSGDMRAVRGVRRVKFQRIVGPGERFELSCELRGPDELHFAFSQAISERLSSGQLLLGLPADRAAQESVDATP